MRMLIVSIMFLVSGLTLFKPVERIEPNRVVIVSNDSYVIPKDVQAALDRIVSKRLP
jgi:hypothetical protein